MSRHEDDWSRTEALIGKIVIQWGHAMGLVYSLPKEMGFENFAAIRLGLAQLNGDGHRLSYMRKLIEHKPSLFHDPRQRERELNIALKSLERIVPERDALIHGIPVATYERDPETREIIREGAYMVQQREWQDSNRFIKIPEVAHDHLQKLEMAHESLQRVAKPMLFETWEEIFGFRPDGDTKPIGALD